MTPKQEITYWSFIPDANKKHVRGDILKNPEKLLAKMLDSKYNFGAYNIKSDGIYMEMGWKYDFRPFLKRYVYKQYGSWHESYAINKTNLRKLIHGRIDKIIEII
jgi:hypothetical protein